MGFGKFGIADWKRPRMLYTELDERFRSELRKLQNDNKNVGSVAGCGGVHL